MIGNALDKGAGYSPYFDHFGFSCGLEIVLGNGEVLRTGDGALDAKELINWHTSKYSFGPILDGLFAQSNLRHRHPHGGVAVAAAAGGALVPLHVSGRRRSGNDRRALPAVEAVEFRADVVPGLQRSLSLRLGGRESGIRASQAASARFPTKDGEQLRESHGLGAWNVSGAFYGPSAAAMEPQIQRVRDMFVQSGKARYIAHEDAAAYPASAGRDQRFLGRSEPRRARASEMAAGRRQYLVPARHADGRHESPTNSSDFAAASMRNSDSITR